MIDQWIFGYGSLIWRPGFPYVESATGFIRGWTRRFWQGSPDHRGTPDFPGRVVTLIRAPEECCWGRVYRLSEDEAPQVLLQLDIREKGGYERIVSDVQLEGGCNVRALYYVAENQNPNFLGPATAEVIVERMAHAVGPSGTNREYVLKLAASLREMGHEDPHVFDLERELLASTS